LVAFGPVLHIVGLLMSIMAIAMLLPAGVDLALGNPDWEVFTGAAALSLFIGVSLMLTTNSPSVSTLSLRQAFLLTTLSWLTIAMVAALPFAFSQLDMTVADAFFESMSGVTTTGSTVIVGLDHAPPGILLWRALLQWLGGIGIIVMALAVLPMLSVGGMQLFQTEAFDTPDKVVPRAAQLAGGISGIYLALTAAWAAGLWAAGLPGFDAIAHAMTTIATGGYSTKDASVGHFDNVVVDWIVVAGMIVGSLPFVYYLRMMRGSIRPIFRDSQVKWFFAIVTVVVGSVTIWNWQELDYPLHDAVRYAAFNIISVMTGTGYATTDYGIWGGFPVTLVICLMFVGGCAGSTTCGIKIFRIQVLYATAQVQIERLLRPHGVFIPYYNHKPIPETVSESVMGFFFLYMLCFGILAALLAAIGLDFITAVSGAATAISNVGPGLGPIIGPAGNFDSLPDSAKWLLSFGMLLGRLELFTVLVMLSPSFWRR
jgi:trk system potassium uptake protein TrkH